MTAPWDVFGLGQCSLDHILVVPHFPAPDGKVEGRGWREQGGGPVATALHKLAGWGRRCAFAGVAGDDGAAPLMAAELESAGVDASRLIVRPGTRSQQAFIAVEEGTGRRQILWQRPTGTPPGPDEIDMPGARVFLTDGLHAAASVDCAKRAPLTVVDAGSLREGTRAMLDHAEVFVASEAFARDLVGADDPAGACRVIREHGARIAGVTLGPRGYVVSFGDTVLERPAHPAEAVDTTGCGDVFHAGVVHGLLEGWSPTKTFDFAAEAAARCAEHVGGRSGMS